MSTEADSTQLEHIRACLADIERNDGRVAAVLPRVRQIRVKQGVVQVVVDPPDLHGQGLVSLTVRGHSLRPTDNDPINQLAARLRGLPGVRTVNVEVAEPDAEAIEEAGKPLETPLQEELREMGVEPEYDPLTMPDLGLGVAAAEEAGYHFDGPPSLGGPGGPRPRQGDDGTYNGPVQVLQWQIDPQNPKYESGEADLEEDGWDYSIWWQAHPAGLVYAAIRALGHDELDDDGKARENPVGRSVAVNVVYDRNRCAVIAIYGTARDFRPFINAFSRVFGLEQPQSADGSDTGPSAIHAESNLS